MRLLHLSADIGRLLLNIFSNGNHLLTGSRKLLCLTGQSAYTFSGRGLINSELINLCYKIFIRKTSNHNCIKSVMLTHFPFFTSGEIVRGFGRGSRELGIPTANFSLEVVKSLPAEVPLGIYYGWANVDNGEVYKMVMSIGTNPYYDNKEKSMVSDIK
ncbi:putative riboflavin kinase [Ceratitis capitata]|uniref:putative riboflavin kinase n=1 Tax=Ceratitis capitata TaxID=7213 RepID=UPI000C6C417E|nr:putative riboflavin kinase [Ceratitis capitata]